MKLKWGETPWDNMSKEELLREVQRLYSAANSMASCLRMTKTVDPTSSYWGPDGSGGHALSKWRVCERWDYSDENLYCAFFRYADELLFGSVVTGFKWGICDHCGYMLGSYDTANVEGKACYHCDGRKLRRITWDDLKPQEAKK